MTEKQYINHLRKMQKIDQRELKVLRLLKGSIETALFRQSLGHTDGWQKVRNLIDKYEDDFEVLI